MKNIKRLKIILSVLFITVLVMLCFNVYYNYQKQYRIIIKTFLELEETIIEQVAKISSLWFYKRINDKDASIDKIEQEIFKEFIDPIHLLENGDAWIYNKSYVIFDKSGDFPDIYKGKNMREIFEIQKKYGAYHYEDLTNGVENATEGTGWYVWLPEKGKEWVAWKSFKFHDQTWTLGLSTPEKEILKNSSIDSFLVRQIMYVTVIIFILLGVSIFIIKFQIKQDRLLLKINDANKALKNIDNMKNEFIANISHDFRIPLTIIFNLSELNLNAEYDLPSELRDDINIIYKTSYKFLSKINTLLDLTKLETSGLKLRIRKINLYDFILEIASFYKSAIEHTGIKLTAKIPDKNSDYFYTDTEKLEDILNNLISNAVKFTDKENGIISILLEETSDSVQIKIKDNGIGIEQKDLDTIFSRFKQADDTPGIKYRGSGIGLSYSRQLAELMGGTIKAESAGLDSGSVFTLTLNKNKFTESDISPDDKQKDYFLKRMIVDSHSEKQNEISTIITETNRQNEFNPYKGIILIVEDEYVIREIIIRYLKAAGYKNFITAYDGEIALKLLKKYHPELIITDYRMPNMSGDEFHTRVSSDPDYEFIPFIFISAIAEEKIILEQKNRGAVDFLLKPIKRNELLVSVNTNMKKYMDFIKISAVDELTGLLNRRVFYKYFENILFSSSISDLSLIMLDLDHFKNINDTYGHQAGDYILTKVCSAILKVIRSHDIAGRLGGEEFAIILPDTNIEHALIAAEKIRITIENLDLVYEGNSIQVTISSGISSLSQCEECTDDPDTKINNISEIIDMADIALYYAKSGKCPSCEYTLKRDETENGKSCPACGLAILSGRNRVEIYNSTMKQFNNK